MSFSLVGSLGAFNATGTGAANTPSYGQTPTAGNLLRLVVGGFLTTSLPATPSGWLLAAHVAAAANVTASIFYKVAAGGDATPTIAAIAGTVWWAQLGEWLPSGGTPTLDQTGSGVGTTGSPVVATAGGADAATGDLVCTCAISRYSAVSTTNLTDTYNNGASAASTNNNGTSIATHYSFAYGTTTGHASADSDSVAISSTTNLLDTAVALASFKVVAAVGGNQIVGVN